MINDKELRAYLAEANAEYTKAPEPEPGDDYEPISDGKYEVAIRMVEIVSSKSSNNMNLKWHLQIIGGKFSGRMLWKYNVLSGESFKWLKKDLAVMGAMVSDLRNLPDILGDLQGAKAIIGLRDNNVFINKRLED
ncbi:MAG: hypothetical protein A2Y72_03340 [Chloroflexi bacterium RBG_13_53_26]|nr:MAG: hypothetical protein A2Y72_03340 [Chloroflexi bacterium RBG_13_53_26]